MEYLELKKGIRGCLDSAAEDFFMVGYFLRKVSEGAFFAEDGYKNIWDFAKGEYGLSASSTSRFMAINVRFSIDGGEHMAEKYIGMGVSKLQEMLGLPDEELEKVTQETTVREIRALKKKQEEPKSFFGLPKTVYPEGSLLSTKGCGDGKYTCFSCTRPCSIRQEERYCRTAPLGNPFSCTQMSGEKRLDMEAGLFAGECQHLHPEFAPVREGDKEPSPCCLTCGHKTCYSRCDVAKKKDGDGRRKEQAELQKWQKEQQKCREEAEARRPEPSERDIKAFYAWIRIKPADNISADRLKEQYRNASGGGEHGLKNYQGSTRGVRINFKREITWVQLAKRLKEIQEAAKAAVKPQTEEPDIIDGDFREVGDSEKQKPITAQESEQETEAETIARDPEAGAEPDPEEYTRLDVDLLLDKYLRDLRKYREAFSGEDCPPPIIKRYVILVDALELLLEKIDFEIDAEKQADST
ncbi:MAG TPA: hypothetical protein DF613_06245 [Lachnospiraceae bacterium]|nr:hypothetical protein [Lachnospiraceae bacterium]